MSAISYEEARRFREAAPAPLTWDESVPAPPLDRIEFTRLILQAAVNAGLPVPMWNVQLIFDESAIAMFQSEIHQYAPRKTYEGIPIVPWSGMRENGLHVIMDIPLRWSKYIEVLEDDYFGPWKYGYGEGSFGRVLRSLKEQAWLRKNSDSSTEIDYSSIRDDQFVGQYLNQKVGGFADYITLSLVGKTHHWTVRKWIFEPFTFRILAEKIVALNAQCWAEIKHY